MDTCWEDLLSGQTALVETDRFDTSAFKSCMAGIVPGLTYHKGTSAVFQMLEKVLAGHAIPLDAGLLLATLNG